MLKLQSMKLQGFKSFHDRTALTFDSAVTAVVGPNGCGKSNILDAFSWVLGEQSVRSLRGDRMEDLIFNGTEKRKPMGMAEVSLNLVSDNGDLPHGLKHVAVTRRLFRSGESEYLINNKSCRLKDIHDILYGTGIGVKEYSIIEQGKIGVILNAKPTERRILIEEAAGITGFRTKKRAALLKLEAAEANLARVRDVFEEVVRQMQHLKRQASKAQKYRQYREELRGCMRIFFALSASSLDAGLSGERERGAAAADLLAGLDSTISQRDAQTEELRLAIEELDRERMREADAAHEVRLEIDRHTNRIAHNQKAIGDLSARVKGSEQEADREAGRLSVIERELSDKARTLEVLAVEFAEISKLVADRDGEHGKAFSDLADSRRALEMAKSEGFECASRKAVLSNEIENRRRDLEQTRRRLERVRGERGACAVAVGALEKTRDGKSAELAANEHEIALLNAKAEALRSEQTTVERELAEAETRLAEEKEKREEARRRVESLAELAEAGAGAGEGVKAGLRRLKETGAAGVVGLLANEVEVVERYEAAVESSLGSVLQQIVVDKTAPARETVEYLKENKLGECAFLVKERMPGEFDAASGAPEGLVKGNGIHGPLASMISTRNGMGMLLKDAAAPYVVVEDIGAALDACFAGAAFDCVTLDGEIVTRKGSVSGGRSGKKGAGLLGIRRERRDLEKTLPALQKKIAECETARDELARRGKEIEQALLTLESELHERDKAGVSFRIELDSVTREFEKARRQLESLDVELQQAEREERTLLEEQDVDAREHAALEDRGMALGRSLDELTARIAALEKLTTDLSGMLTDSRMEMAGRGEAKKGVETEIARLRESAEETAARLDGLTAGTDRMKTARTTLEGEIKDSESALSSNLTVLEQKEKRIAGMEEQTKERRERVEEARTELHLLKTRSEEARAASMDIEIRIAKLEGELNHAIQRCTEELNENAANLWQGLTEEERATDLGECRAAMERLKEQIDRMGAINLMAVEEYDQLVERHEFLDTQVKDLNQSIASLRETIQQIDKTSRERFKETFEKVNEFFGKTFETLFEGGRAFLDLTDKDDLLESGIEVVAQPPGKRLQNILLLSGGEKALSAVSLLFALFQYRPSPFCILDEVDAPLDDANIGRFLRLLKHMSEKTQFILITHSRRTMEWADALYGVTMEEPGVSKIVSVMFNEAHAV